MNKNVFLTGTFDGELHEGHINLLTTAKKYGDVYAIVVPDWVVRKLKNREPINTQINRMMNVLETDFVTGVIAMNGKNEQENLKQILHLKPDIYIFGEFQGKGEFDKWNQELERSLIERGTEIYRVPRVVGISTTQKHFIINKG